MFPAMHTWAFPSAFENKHQQLCGYLLGVLANKLHGFRQGSVIKLSYHERLKLEMLNSISPEHQMAHKSNLYQPTVLRIE